MKTDVLRLNDTDLQTLYAQAQTEIRRRTRKTLHALDDATLIKASEMGKRALTVAAAGKHSIVFIGPPESGKSLFRALALNFEGVDAFELRPCPCPCGYRGDPRNPCTCTPRQRAAYFSIWPQADIYIQIVPPLERELRSTTPGTSTAEMKNYVAQATNYTALALDDDGATLLKAACSELAIGTGGRERVLHVARTIANLDSDKNIHPRHLCEAINYQTPYYRRAF